MTDLVALVAGMPAEEQAVAAKVLDACSRPLTAREIEALIRHAGHSRTFATKWANVFKHWKLIALVGPEDPGGAPAKLPASPADTAALPKLSCALPRLAPRARSRS